jgi:hypothetical protein
MSSSIFPDFTFDREVCNWHDHLYDLTPVEKRGSLWFKREDTFAPFGYGGINGSKLRQLIHLLETDKNRPEGPSRGLLTGSSVMSPQIPMGAAVARHYGLTPTVVVGATHPKAAIRNPMVEMGAWFGARYDLKVRVAFNPILQNRVANLHKGVMSDHFVLEYGITRDHKIHTPEMVLAFHEVGAAQVQNLPPEAKRLIVPAGSCNSATSILHGIAKYRPQHLEEIYLIGIGPSKLRLIAERLAIFQRLTDINHTIFSPTFEDDTLPVLYPESSVPFFMEQETEVRPYRLHFIDLHGTKQVKYHDRVPWEYEGITFHPTYEGKIMRWLHEKRPDLISPENLFWIVGSEPKIENMIHLKAEIGEVPESIVVAHELEAV